MLVWDLDKNFWEINGTFYLFFKNLKDEDASKGKIVSSIKMWCIAMMGADSSPLKNMTIEEKELVLRDSFLKAYVTDERLKKEAKKANKDNSKAEYVDVFKIFNKDLNAPLVERMVNITHSKAKKLLRMWENKLEERQLFINTTPYDKTSYEMLEKIIPPTAKMWQEYYRLKKESEEENEQSVRGGTEESFLEKEYGN